MSVSLPDDEQLVPAPTVLGRAEWGADESLGRGADGAPSWPVRLAEVRAVVLHHTATRSEADPLETVRRVHHFHAVERRWGDLGYSFLVLPDGRILEGRRGSSTAPAPFGVVAGHAYGHNVGTLGVALVGRFDDAPPPAEAWESLVGLLAWTTGRYGLDPNGGPVTLANGRRLPAVLSGHRQCRPTTCPGDALAGLLPQLRREVGRALA